MNWMQLVSSLVGSLAWPAAMLVLLLVYRSPVERILARPLKRLKAGPIEAEYWEYAVGTVRREVNRVAIDQGEMSLTTAIEADVFRRDVLRATEADPARAVLDTYVLLERQIRALLAEEGIEPNESLSVLELADVARRHGLLRPETANGIEGLTVMRNLVLSDLESGRLDPDRAREFVELAFALMYAIRSKR